MGEPRRVELVEQTFHEALECDDARRAGFLAEACAGDVALLAEVASLLASYEQDHNFLQTPAFNLSASDLAGNVYSLAEVLTRLGDKDRALDNLAYAIKMREDHRVTQLKVNPILDPLRSDPRFAELLLRMNLK
jgi:hypothetical protein